MKPWTVYQPSTDYLAVSTPAGNMVEWPTNYCPEDVADARLIAAAPEMLDALNALREAVRVRGNVLPDFWDSALTKAHNAAVAAITKAEGK